MYQNLKKKSEGFTIIEVLIVLAIAGLIMLIVFLAVPALQRNSRNNSRRNDASRVLAATSEWRANNNNQMPTSGDVGAILELAGDLNHFDGLTIQAKNNSGYDNLNYYASQNEVQIVTGADCASGSSKSAGSGIVAILRVETGNNQSAPICIAS